MKALRVTAMGIVLALVPGGQTAEVAADPTTFHLVMVSEVFSNSSGTQQFVELIAVANFQTNLAPTHMEALDAAGANPVNFFEFVSSFSWSNGDHLLLATQGVADELGFAPDFLIPDGSITLTSGRVLFDRDIGGAVDAVAYGAYTGSNTGWGFPAPALPTDGESSLNRINFSFIGQDNSQDFISAVNSPTRRDGTTGQLGQAPSPPVLAPIGSQGVDEGQLLLVVVSATDPDATIPSLTAEDLPAGASFTDHADGTGTFEFTPGYLQAGSYFPRFIASDVDSADTEVVTITVNDITDPPTASDGALVTGEDALGASVLTASDPDGDSISFSILSGPFHGLIQSLNVATGEYSYLPDQDYNGADSITFEASDSLVSSNIAKVLITVTPVNDPPVAGDVVQGVVVDEPIAIAAMPVTDVDNGSWIIEHVSGPFNGQVSGFVEETGAFTFTPDPGYLGEDSIIYSANDGELTSNLGAIRLTVVSGCLCNFQADLDASSFVDSIDLSLLIDVIFFGGTDPLDPTCPTTRGDFNNDGFADSIDLSEQIDHVFFGGPPPADPCGG